MGSTPLRTMLNWATRERHSGNPLLASNPLKGMRPPVEKNPKRPVETYDRYLSLISVAGEVDWRLPLALSLAESTGQRISSILGLQRRDVDLDRGPSGRVLFRAENQKTGFEHWVPLSEECRGYALRHLEHVEEDPKAWIFPAQQDRARPIDKWTMSNALRRLYRHAGVEKLVGGLWHPWRRKWATERKDMPLRDVAAAGGWRDPTTLLKCYQQPDEDTIERVVLDAPKLMSRPVRGVEVTPKVTPRAGEASGKDRRKAG